MKEVLILIGILWLLVNLTQPKAGFNLNIKYGYAFSLHPLFSVYLYRRNYHNTLQHELYGHCIQQAKLTLPLFIILYIVYSIRGMYKYGFKKTNFISIGLMSKPLDKPRAKWYVYNPLETEAFMRERIKQFTKIHGEIEITAFSHLSNIYKPI